MGLWVVSEAGHTYGGGSCSTNALQGPGSFFSILALIVLIALLAELVISRFTNAELPSLPISWGMAPGTLRQSLSLCREIGDRTIEADILASLGVASLRQGRFPQAAEYLRQAVALLRQTGDLARQALALNSLGELLLATDRPAEARASHATALDLATQAGEKYEQARAHHGLAGSYQRGGDLRSAHRHWREALARYTEVDAPEADQIQALLAVDAAQA